MKHKKLKVRVIKEINEKSNSKIYKVGDIISVQEIRPESEYYHCKIDKYTVDMILKDFVEIVTK